MIDIVKEIAKIELSHNLHLTRLLILLAEFSKNNESIDGLSKLAKLDFLLRYPTILERALEAKKKSTKKLAIKNHERICVESVMIRYQFGPWDNRYRTFLNILIGKGIAALTIDNKKVLIQCTTLGMETASIFSDNEDFLDYFARAELIRKNFNLTGDNLTKFIYEIFPEVLTLQQNAQITL